MVEIREMLAIFPPAQQPAAAALAETALALGCKVEKDPGKTPGWTFTHRKRKKRVLRFVLRGPQPIICLKYFAAPSYSTYFQEAVRKTIEEFDYKYTGCYGCGKCDGVLGYTYLYPDGRSYCRCGSELIELQDVAGMPVDEAVDLLRQQCLYYDAALAAIV